MAHNDRQGQCEAGGGRWSGSPTTAIVEGRKWSTTVNERVPLLTYQHWNPGHVVGSASNRLSGEIASRLWLRSAGQVPALCGGCCRSAEVFWLVPGS